MKLHKLTCPNCNGSLDLNVDDGTTSVFCPYCGQRFCLDDEQQKYTITRNINKNINVNKYIHNRYTDDADVIRATNEANKDSRDFKQVLIVWGAIIGLFAIVLGGLVLHKQIAKSQGKVNAGYYADLLGKDYETVEAHFEAAGFTNIKLIDLDDSGIAFWDEGKVETISVGGDTKFDSDDWFDPNTKVVISYH